MDFTSDEVRFARELEGYIPDEYEAEMPMAHRLARRDAFYWKRQKFGGEFTGTFKFWRTIMTRLGAPRSCHLRGCRRAKSCAAPKIDCLFRNLPMLQAEVMPGLDAAVRERLGQDDSTEEGARA